VARANEYVFLGNFELDFEEGTVSYKASIILEKAPLHDDIIKHLLFANLYAADSFFPASAKSSLAIFYLRLLSKKS
jgi:hypothetical protein